jgi:hypothetical protein
VANGRAVIDNQLLPVVEAAPRNSETERPWYRFW